MCRRGFLFGLTSLPLLADAGESVSSLERRVFEAINFQRACEDCQPLAWHDLLGRLARAHSVRMLEGRFFGHVDPQFGDLEARLNAARVAYSRSGENVFSEKGHTDPVSLAVVEWMYSAGHRKNLLTPEYTRTGVGVAIGQDGATAITQQFLTELPPGAMHAHIIHLPS